MLRGCDVSFYQDDNATVQQIDFAKMRQSGAHFVVIRAGQNINRDAGQYRAGSRYRWAGD